MYSINNLVETYIDFIKENITVEKIDDNLFEIETPFLDRKNDFIAIYAKFDQGNILLTDNGETITDLELSGMKFNSPKRKQELELVLNGLSINFDKKTNSLSVPTTESSFAYKKHNLIQAILSINDMFVLSENKIMSFFFEDVGYYFDEHEIRYSANIDLEGKSKFLHKFDFLIPKSKNMPERCIKLLNRPKKENIKASLFSFEDTREKRKGDGYIILNDEEFVSTDLVQAVSEYGIKPILWSQRDNYLDALAG